MHNKVAQLVATIRLTVLRVNRIDASDLDNVALLQAGGRSCNRQRDGRGRRPAGGQETRSSRGLARERSGSGVRTERLIHYVLIEFPVHPRAVGTHNSLFVLLADLRVRIKQALQRVNNGCTGERFNDAGTATITRRTFSVKVSASGQVGDQTSRRRAGGANDVGGRILRHYQTITIHLICYGCDRGFENAI